MRYFKNRLLFAPPDDEGAENSGEEGFDSLDAAFDGGVADLEEGDADLEAEEFERIMEAAERGEESIPATKSEAEDGEGEGDEGEGEEGRPEGESEGEGEEGKEGEGDEGDGEEGQEGGEPETFDVLADVRKNAPTAVLEDEKAIGPYVAELQEAVLSYRQFEEIHAASERYQKFTEAVAANKMKETPDPDWKVAFRVFKDVLQRPNEDDDPDAAAEWDRRFHDIQLEDQYKQRDEEKEKTTQEQMAARRQEEFETQFARIASDRKLENGQAESLAAEIRKLVFGDPVTGRIPHDAVERLAFAATFKDRMAELESRHKEEMEKAVEEATKKGKTEGIQQVRKARSAQNLDLPDLSGSGGDDVEENEFTKAQRQLEHEMGADLTEEDDLFG